MAGRLTAMPGQETLPPTIPAKPTWAPGLSRSARRLRAVAAALAATVTLAACSGLAAGSNGGSSGGDGSTQSGDSPAAGGQPAHRHKHRGSVTITAVGDTMLGSTPALPPDPATFFDEVKPQLTGKAQIVFGNLEGTLTTASGSKCGGANGGSCFAFRDPPSWAKYYKQAGFTVLNDANNHSFDFGPAGQQQTVRSIRAAGMAQTGLPGQITVVRAHRIKVAFVAFAPYDWSAKLTDVPAARALIEQAAAKAPIVVVYMHAGGEGSDADHVTGKEEIFLGEDRGNPQAFAKMAIDAGASLVIASGPHVLRGMEFYHHHLIAYSLGNFAGYGNFATEGVLNLSAILRVRLSATGKFERAHVFPVQFAGKGQPVPGGDTISFVSRLSAEDFGPHAARFSRTGRITPP
jgi:hypothetical protein